MRSNQRHFDVPLGFVWVYFRLNPSEQDFELVYLFVSLTPTRHVHPLLIPSSSPRQQCLFKVQGLFPRPVLSLYATCREASLPGALTSGTSAMHHVGGPPQVTRHPMGQSFRLGMNTIKDELRARKREEGKLRQQSQ